MSRDVGASLLDQPVSQLADHKGHCCARARSWLLSLDRSLSLATGIWSTPTWLLERYEWGPAIWPISWCQLPTATELDCGALAALAREVFRSRGWEAVPVQMLQRFSENDARHWRRRWSQAGASTGWMNGDLAYHEAVGILRPARRLRVWDPTDGMWLEPAPPQSYGSTQAIRVITQPGDEIESLEWEGMMVEVNTWSWMASMGDIP